MAKQKGSNARRPVGLGGRMRESFAGIYKFFGDVWREVHPRTGRVAWPSFKSVKVSTAVVIVSSVLLGVYIFFCDLLCQHLYRFIMGIGSTAS